MTANLPSLAKHFNCLIQKFFQIFKFLIGFDPQSLKYSRRKMNFSLLISFRNCSEIISTKFSGFSYFL